MSPAFIKGVRENFDWATITFDRFHVKKIMNEAVDKIRREEVKTHLELRNTRFLWLKNQVNLTPKQANTYEGQSNSNLKTGKAYRIKLTLQDIYATETDKITAMGELKKWLFLPFILDFFKMLLNVAEKRLITRTQIVSGRFLFNKWLSISSAPTSA